VLFPMAAARLCVNAVTWTARSAGQESGYGQARMRHTWPTIQRLAAIPVELGTAMLRAINEEIPDIAFLDIRMPGLTGLEVAPRIDGKTHVVFVTAYDQCAVEAFDREAVDYLLKPVSDERLEKAIERLKRKLAGAETPRPQGARSAAHYVRAQATSNAAGADGSAPFRVGGGGGS